MPLTATFDADGLTAGTYTTKLVISSNDPDEDSVEVAVALTISSQCVEKIVNGGFELNTGWVIPITQYPAGYTSEVRRSGSRSMRVGIVESADNWYSYSSARQTVTIPADADSVTLRFYLFPFSGELAGTKALTALPSGAEMANVQLTDDLQYVLILDENDQVLGGTVVWEKSNNRRWESYTVDLSGPPYAGQTVKLVFGAFNDGGDGVTGMYVDDVSLEVCYQEP